MPDFDGLDDDESREGDDHHSLPDVGDEAKPADKPEKPPVFATVSEWVEDWLAPMLSARKFSDSPGKGLRWDPQWWQYPEVGDRLISLWKAWEGARYGDSAAMSSWWIHHFEPHMRVILDGETGPFHRYDPNAARPKLRALPVEPTPDHLVETWASSQTP